MCVCKAELGFGCILIFLNLASHLRESIQRGVYVDGLLEQVVTTAADAYHVSDQPICNCMCV